MKIKIYHFRPVFVVLCLIFSKIISAQTPFPAPGIPFSDQNIPRVDIFIPEDTLAWIFDWENRFSDEHWRATFVFDNGVQRDTVRDIGFRLRGNTSRSSAKKSFKISFNTFESGRKWYGLEKLNLNGSATDPTMLRSKLSWDVFRSGGVIASRCNFVRLYINGRFHGFYSNVEHVDEEFVALRFGNKSGNLYKCLYPADLRYKGDDPDLYKELFNGRPAYALQTNTAANDYSDLAHFIDVLNNTPVTELPCALEEIFEVDAFLRTLAAEVLMGHWDNYAYNKNNFYLYNNPATGKFHYLPYDIDHSFGLDWLGQDFQVRDVYAWNNGNESRRLYTRLMQVAPYRRAYTGHLKALLEEVMHPDTIFPKIDAWKNRISPWAVQDSFRALDFGFLLSDFSINFQAGLPLYAHTRFGIKEFVQLRYQSALQQLENTLPPPVIADVFDNTPTAGWTSAAVLARIGGIIVPDSVLLVRLMPGGGVIRERMYDDGQHADWLPNDGVFGLELGTLPIDAATPYYVFAAKGAGQGTRYPSCGWKQLPVFASNFPVLINEIMAQNTTTIKDEAGQYEDWVELANLDTLKAVSLQGFFLSDNPSRPDKWAFPPTANIPAGGKLVVWADDDANQGPLHATFKLAQEGEYIGLYYREQDGSFSRVDGFYFGPQTPDVSFARIPDASGVCHFAEPTFLAVNTPVTDVVWVENTLPKIQIYPNPFQSELYLAKGSGDFTTGTSHWEVTVFDQLGQIFWNSSSISFSSDKISISTIGWPDGMYFLRIQHLESRWSRVVKVIKMPN